MTGSGPGLDARHASGGTSRAVGSWHALLRANAVLSLALLFATADAVAHLHYADDEAPWRLQLALSALYVFGCVFRSMLPVYDAPRIVLVDSPLSSVMVGRSVATVAELCFASQWALMLHAMALPGHSPLAQAVSLALMPLIVPAEACSWYAVLTTRQRGHAVENSIWGLSAALMVAGLLVIGPHRIAELYLPTLAWCIGGAAYVGFIFLIDVPMYWSRGLADEASERPYLSITQGLVDICRRRIVSYRWEDWRSEMLWMSLYFTLGVWSSLSLVFASVALGAHRN